jgi:hypothetical protein
MNQQGLCDKRQLGIQANSDFYANATADGMG